MIRSLTAQELADLAGDAAEAGFGAVETSRGCLPLRSMSVDARIEGLAAATTVRQTFANVFDEPLEATYIFPLPPRAAVVGFTMTVDGRTIRGRIDERGQARHDYDTAVAEGRQAAIVEEERPDVFTLRVGNIPPRSNARVEFTLVAPVAIDGLEATWRFPLVVAARYCPGSPLGGEQVGDGTAPDTDLAPDASRLSPPVLLPGFASPVRLSIAVHMASTAAASAAGDTVACSLPVEELLAAAGDRTVRVLPGQRLDRDMILRWPIGDSEVAASTAVIEPDADRVAGLGTAAACTEAPGCGTFTVTIVPPAEAAATARPRDVVFVLDRSGSMQGWKIVAARRAVARAIDSLSPRDRVTVLAFDNVIEHSGATLAFTPATDRNRWRMLEWLGGVEARGGTELAAAVDRALGLCADARRSSETLCDAGGRDQRDRVVVLVTDGQVGDEERSLRALAARLGDTRLFIVGIDTAVNEGLLGRMADASGGLVELVESEERLDDVMDRIRRRIAAPLVTDLGITGHGIEVVAESIVPARMPDLVPGLPVVLRGRYQSATPGARLCVEGRDATGGRWQTTATVAPATAPGLASLWARGRLRQLEDCAATDLTGGDLADLEARIVSLSTSFGVLCRLTALVAIDDREPDASRRQPPPRRIVQPVDVSGIVGFGKVACMEPIHAMRSARFSVDFAAQSLSPPSPPSSSPLDRVPRSRSGWWSWGASTAGVRKPEPTAGQRRRAARIVAAARPRSGRLDDVTPALVIRIVGRVKRLVAAVEKRCGSFPTSAGSLLFWLAMVEGTPTDRAAFSVTLECLADFAEAGGPPVDRWWNQAAARKA